jgi:type IX secretion system PorP/SprF family membrane protein
MFTGVVSYAQQDAQFTEYMYNTVTINSAYAGSRGALSVFALHRAQWVGLDGAPVTNTLSTNTPINNSNVGLGISFINDRIGPSEENAISIDLSYTIHTSATYKLSFGIKGTANLFNLDVSKLNPEVQGDPKFQNLNNQFSPNFGAGLYFHSNKSYIGLSVPNLIESTHYSNNDLSIFKERINYYFIAGHVFDLNESIKFKPSLFSKLTQGAPLQLDLSGNFLINKKFVIGAAYRWNAAVSALVGFQIYDGLFAGYSYDLETTKLENYNSGSHEIFLRFELFKNHNKITSPRFF